MTAQRFFEFLRRWRVLLQILAALWFAAAYVWLRNDALLVSLESSVLDARFYARPIRPPPKDIMVIGVDETCLPDTPWTPAQLAAAPDLAYLTKSWPWDHAFWGKFTDRLLNAGAKVVALDFLFHDPSPGDIECGAIFDRHADKIAITSELIGSDNAMGGAQPIVEPVDDLVPEQGPEIVGLANFPPDDDGTVRRITHGFNRILLMHPELASHPEKIKGLKPDLFSFTWIAATKALGQAPARDPAKPMVINYYYRSGYINTTTVADILLNWHTHYQDGKVLQGKEIFIGALSETRFKDQQNTPFGKIPGVELQAVTFSNLVNGDWLRLAAAWVAPLLAITFALGSVLINLRIHSVLIKVGLFAAVLVGFLFVTQWLFNAAQLVIPVGGAFLGLVLCGGFGTVYDFLLERYERRRMLGVFETMVSPGVAKLVLSDREDFEHRLGGERRPVVILFSDIRGFTTWSEKVGPDALVAQLNEYFQGMVEVIQQEGGTVQKYIGDALMAAWGDVREQPLRECALQAVRAAWRMEQELKKLNDGWVGKPKREQLGFGIGINLGEGVVGRIGHTRRQEFTVMGDAVNLAARLESATKQYHQTILAGEHIYEHAKDTFDFRLADKMQVKGKTFAVPVYTPMGPKSAMPPPGLAEYEAAIVKYYARDFAGAAEWFRAANEKMGGGDFLCENYLERCCAYQAEPPPPDWDGAWVLKEK